MSNSKCLYDDHILCEYLIMGGTEKEVSYNCNYCEHCKPTRNGPPQISRGKWGALILVVIIFVLFLLFFGAVINGLRP
jgi:hypothetical protein